MNFFQLVFRHHYFSIFKQLCLFALISIASVYSHANFITLAFEDLLTLEQDGDGVSLQTNDATSVLTNYTLDSVTFLSFWLFNSDGFNEGTIRTPVNWSEDWTGANSFQQHIINRDESPWSFTASINDGASTFVSETLLLEGTVGGQIDPGITDGTLFIDLTNVAKESIKWVKFSVSGILPVNNYDRVSEYELLVQFEDINPIPLPPGALLFSSALALLIVRKKYPVKKSTAQEEVVEELLT